MTVSLPWWHTEGHLWFRHPRVRPQLRSQGGQLPGQHWNTGHHGKQSFRTMNSLSSVCDILTVKTRSSEATSKFVLSAPRFPINVPRLVASVNLLLSDQMTSLWHLHAHGNETPPPSRWALAQEWRTIKVKTKAPTFQWGDVFFKSLNSSNQQEELWPTDWTQSLFDIDQQCDIDIGAGAISIGYWSAAAVNSPFSYTGVAGSFWFWDIWSRTDILYDTASTSCIYHTCTPSPPPDRHMHRVCYIVYIVISVCVCVSVCVWPVCRSRSSLGGTSLNRCVSHTTDGGHMCRRTETLPLCMAETTLHTQRREQLFGDKIQIKSPKVTCNN